MSTLSLPPDHLERVYAGVLGKLIGVYLGRPFENWTHQRIISELGLIKYYVNDKLDVPLVVTDDDVSGTFAFVRALEEHPRVDSEAIGKTWLNNVVEKQSVFWWGGRGISTEHTAYLNLKHGIPAPRSGSIEVNGQTIAEQIGAQIFIDGWALVCPGQPERASQFAEAAGKVSHDGESVYAAMLWAAMEAEAFVSKDIDHLIDTGLGFIPSDALISRIIAEVRQWVKTDGDWLRTRQRIEDKYGYDKFQGACHVVPNHAIMIMSVLYSPDSFSRALEIIMTCGWDTDCNGGNVACLMAIIHGMDSFTEDDRDWRGPIADRALISSADNGYSINNAARIAVDLCNAGRKLAGKAALVPPKDGAYFHFTLPGSVQGFRVTEGLGRVSQGKDGLHIETGDGDKAEVMTPTAAPKELLKFPPVYPLCSSPLVYPGQRVKAVLKGKGSVRLRLKAFDAEDDLVPLDSDEVKVSGQQTLEWVLPQTPGSFPISELGLVTSGEIWMDSMSWSGTPEFTLLRPPGKTHRFWDLAWTKSVDDWFTSIPGNTVFIARDQGEGIASYGTRDWTDYRITASNVSIKLGKPCGVAIRVQGLNRYYSLCSMGDGHIALIKALDEQRTVLAREVFDWKVDQGYKVTLEAVGNRLRGSVGGVTITAEDDQYEGGGMAFIVTDGAISSGPIEVGSASSPNGH